MAGGHSDSTKDLIIDTDHTNTGLLRAVLFSSHLALGCKSVKVDKGRSCYIGKYFYFIITFLCDTEFPVMSCVTSGAHNQDN